MIRIKSLTVTCIFKVPEKDAIVATNTSLAVFSFIYSYYSTTLCCWVTTCLSQLSFSINAMFNAPLFQLNNTNLLISAEGLPSGRERFSRGLYNTSWRGHGPFSTTQRPQAVQHIWHPRSYAITDVETRPDQTFPSPQQIQRPSQHRRQRNEQSYRQARRLCRTKETSRCVLLLPPVRSHLKCCLNIPPKRNTTLTYLQHPQQQPSPTNHSTTTPTTSSTIQPSKARTEPSSIPASPTSGPAAGAPPATSTTFASAAAAGVRTGAARGIAGGSSSKDPFSQSRMPTTQRRLGLLRLCRRSMSVVGDVVLNAQCSFRLHRVKSSLRSRLGTGCADPVLGGGG